MSQPLQPSPKRLRKIASTKRLALLAEQGHRCAYCLARLPPAAATVDHILPIALGGGSEDENLVVTCHDCNQAKGDLHPAEWVARIKGEG
jgi:5-methylcytosine-specific restriction endonuclease McrA